MSLESDIALLRNIPLFEGLPGDQLRMIGFGAARHELAPGHVLFREQARATSGFVVTSGTIELATGEGAQRKVRATCQAGALIGELALLIDMRRAATATAVAPSQVLEIERKQFLRLLNEYPAAAIRIRGLLAERLAATVDELSRVGEAPAPEDKQSRRG
jgi:CRP-like cAMP-binding protein